MSTSPFIRLASGRKFHLLKPRLNEVDIHDISHALSQLCRFTGHTRQFYSVAQHCCHVSDQLPKSLKLPGLLHDAGEAFVNDMASPLKAQLPTFKEIEHRIEKVIARKYRLSFPYPAAVKVADLTLLATEARDLVKDFDISDLPYPPLDEKIVPWSIEKARAEFLKRFTALSA